jgi:hypothetical protein
MSRNGSFAANDFLGTPTSCSRKEIANRIFDHTRAQHWLHHIKYGEDNRVI